MIDYVKVAQNAIRSLPPNPTDTKVERMACGLIAFAYLHTEALTAAAQMRRDGRALRLDSDHHSDKLWLEYEDRHVWFRRTSEGKIEMGGTGKFESREMIPTRDVSIPDLINPEMKRAIMYLVSGQA